MMILRSSPLSPFGRKVRIALSLLGFDAEVTIEPADPTDVSDSLRRQNPLGKIPVLLAEDGIAYYNSRVILEYLDDRAGGGGVVARRQAALRRVAPASAMRRHARCFDPDDLREPLAQGRERRAEMARASVRKVARGLAAFVAAPPALDPAPRSLPHVGQVALACALRYRDCRFGGGWRSEHPRLVAWLDNFAARVPAFAATKATV